MYYFPINGYAEGGLSVRQRESVRRSLRLSLTTAGRRLRGAVTPNLHLPEATADDSGARPSGRFTVRCPPQRPEKLKLCATSAREAA